MWIFLPGGMVFPAIRPPWSVPEGDDRTLQLRSRVPEHLDNIRSVMGEKLGPNEHTGSFDYEVRAYCTPEDFAAYMAAEITAIDYERFKPTTARFPKTDKALHTIYTGMWSHLFSRISTDEHQLAYARGASEDDIRAAAGSADIEIPKHAATTYKGDWQKYLSKGYRVPATGKALTPYKRGSRRTPGRIDLTPTDWAPYADEPQGLDQYSWAARPGEDWRDIRDDYWASKSSQLLGEVTDLFSDTAAEPVDYDEWKETDDWGREVTLSEVMEKGGITSKRGKKNFRKFIRDVFFEQYPLLFESEIPGLIVHYQISRGQRG